MMHDEAGGAAATILLKRAYDAPDAGDGVRILVDRLWPRGVSKAAAELDAWMRALGPSDALRKQFGHQPERWDAFVTHYRDELLTPMRQTLLAALHGVASHATLTLVYGARDTQENEAVVLRQYLRQERSSVFSGWDAPTKLLIVVAAVAAAQQDAVASAPSVDRLSTSLAPPDEIAGARSTLVADGHLRPVADGWELTARGRSHLRELQRAAVLIPT